MNIEVFKDVLIDSLLDTLKVFPFLLVIYIIIELLENKTNISSDKSRLSGKLGPLLGSATGLIPQCGFSAMAAKLYDKGIITVGTLLGVFIATSDEAFIILLSSGQGAVSLLPMILIKITVGTIVGYLVDLILRKSIVEVEPKVITSRDVFLKNETEEKEQMECDACGKIQEAENPVMVYFISPLLHSLKIALYIFLITFFFGLLVQTVGEDNFISFMERNLYVQPFLTCLVGLIPNCASSVIITEVFLQGGISFGSCTAGLCANAGIGFLVLLKNTKKWKRNIAILSFLYGISVVVGLVINAVLSIG